MVKLSRLAVKKDAHEDGVWSLAWTPPAAGGESTLLSGSVDETVKAWRVDGDSADGLAAVEEYTGHILGVVSVAASASGLAATSSLDSVIRVWDLASGQARAIFETPPAETWQLAFPPGEAGARHLASAGGASASVVLWNLETKAKDATFALPPPVRGPSAAQGGHPRHDLGLRAHAPLCAAGRAQGPRRLLRPLARLQPRRPAAGLRHHGRHGRGL